MFPYRPDDLGQMPPIPAVATLATVSAANMTYEAMTAEVEQRAAEFEADLKPKGTVTRFLARRAAFLAVRLEQMQRYHAAMTAQRVRRAESEYTQNRLAEVDHLFSWLAAEPAVYTRRLAQSPEGIDRMLDAWAGLRQELTDPDFPRWGAEHKNLALSLLARRPIDLPIHPITVWSDAYLNNYSPVVEANPEFAPLTRSQRQVLAAEKLLNFIDTRMGLLREQRAALDPNALEADRREAIDRACFDPSPAGKLATRYEMSTERNLHRALQWIEDLDATLTPETQVEPDDLVEAGPSSPAAEPKNPFLGPIGKRSRRKVAVQRAAQDAAADHATTIQTAPTDPKTAPTPRKKTRR